MRTNIALDDALVKQAFKVSQAKTKKALVHEALHALIKQGRRLDIRDLYGQDLIDPGYDYKTARSGRRSR